MRRIWKFSLVWILGDNRKNFPMFWRHDYYIFFVKGLFNFRAFLNFASTRNRGFCYLILLWCLLQQLALSHNTSSEVLRDDSNNACEKQTTGYAGLVFERKLVVHRNKSSFIRRTYGSLEVFWSLSWSPTGPLKTEARSHLKATSWEPAPFCPHCKISSSFFWVVFVDLNTDTGAV